MCNLQIGDITEFDINNQKVLGRLDARNYIANIRIGYEYYRKLTTQFEHILSVATLLDAFENKKTDVIARYKKARERETFYISIISQGFLGGFVNAKATKAIANVEDWRAIKEALLQKHGSLEALKFCDITVSTKMAIYVFEGYSFLKDSDSADVFNQVIECITV